MKNPSLHIRYMLLACAAFLVLSACNPTRRLQEGEVFLKKNKLVVDADERLEIPTYELEDLIRPKPNRRTAVFRFNLWAYNQVSPERQERAKLRKLSKTQFEIERLREKRVGLKDSSRKALRLDKRIDKKVNREVRGWRDWMRETVGEPPVVVDLERSRKTEEYLEIFLQKKGYFRNSVDLEVDSNRTGRRARVIYKVKPGPAFRLDTITYEIRDSLLAGVSSRYMGESLLKPGMRFDVDEMNKERSRIANYLVNHGYYGFVKEYIAFEADSTRGNRKVGLNMVLKGLPAISPEAPDSLIEIPHRKYFIRNIEVHTDYQLTDPNYDPRDTIRSGGISICYNQEPSIDPDLVFCTLGITPGDLYAKKRIDQTYRRFLELDVFNSVNLRFEPVLDGPIPQLDVYIFASPSEKHSVSLETRGTHRDGNLGIQANLAYQHKNLFAGAESARSRLRFGLEAQQPLTTTQTGGEIGEDVSNTLRLNTFEIGPELSLKLHRLFPLGCDQVSRSSNPQSELTAAFSYQLRPDYERSLWQIRYGVNWIENVSKGRTFFIDFPEVSVIKIQKSEAFQNILDELNDDFLSASYNDHLILGSGLSVVTNSQKLRKQRQYYFNRTSLDLAGNVLRGINKAFGGPQNDSGNFLVAGIQYAQYVKIEEDFRFYRRLDESNNLAFRINPGIGIPYGNLRVLPFEKSFFAGGSNSIRAWQARTLGPGSFRDTTALETFNNIGDIRLEASMEYRFRLTSMFEAAFFLDAGNVWLLRPDDLRPGADWEASRFLSEIAVGGGLGVRLDFDFFLLRFDFGFQLKDPTKVRGERWFWEPKDEYAEYLERFLPPDDLQDGLPFSFRVPLQFNLGIGYPF